MRITAKSLVYAELARHVAGKRKERAFSVAETRSLEGQPKKKKKGGVRSQILKA